LLNFFKRSKNSKKLNFFEFLEKAYMAFQRLKEVFIIVSIFYYYNSKKPIYIEIDTLEFTLARVLIQQQE